MLNKPPDPTVWDHRYEGYEPPHNEASCRALANALCDRMWDVFLPEQTAQRIISERMAEYYLERSDEFSQDYAELHRDDK